MKALLMTVKEAKEKLVYFPHALVFYNGAVALFALFIRQPLFLFSSHSLLFFMQQLM